VDGAIRIFENPFVSAAGENASEEPDTGDGPPADSSGPPTPQNKRKTAMPIKSKSNTITPQPRSFKITLPNSKLESRILEHHKANLG